MASVKDVFTGIGLKYGYVLIMLNFGFIQASPGHVREYCSSENFRPRCGADEVVVMDHAVYGRMRQGKCLESTTGLGCQTNILDVLDRKCSSQNSCDVYIHTDLKSIPNSCPPDMIRYLEAAYMCEKVLEIETTQCHSSTTTTEVSSTITISSAILSNAHCGSSTLEFASRPGQTLNISIIDFMWDEQHGATRSCLNYLELKDTATSPPLPVCAGTERRRHIMTSSGNEITAVFHVQDPTNQHFLLQFQAIGCGDITPPEGTWVRRDGDQTTLGCHSGKHTWTLRCEHNQWVGAVGSCGTGFIVQTEEIEPQQVGWNISTGMVVFAMFSILVFMCSSIFTIAVCACGARNGSRTANQAPHPGSLKCHNAQTLPLMIPATHGTLHMDPRAQAFIRQQSYPYDRQTMESTRIVKPIHTGQGGNTSSNDDSGLCDDQQMYFNSTNSHTDSMYSDSVKYYMLENPNEQNQISS